MLGQNERRFILRFSSGEKPQLLDTSFHYGSNIDQVIFKPSDAIGWGTGTQALALFFIEYAVWAKSHIGNEDFTATSQTKESTWSNTLAGLLEVESWLASVFHLRNGCPTFTDEKTLLKWLFEPAPGDFRHGKKATRTVRIRRAFLPPECVQIEQRDKQLTETRDLETLQFAVDRQWQPKRLSKHRSMPVVDESRIPHNLPDAPKHIYGQRKFRKKLTAKLGKKGLVVLHEMGGMGKTTLAKLAANDAWKSQMVPGGVAWMDCWNKPEFENLLRKITLVLMGSRMPELRVEDCEIRLKDYLAKKHALLVLDNFETIGDQELFNDFLRDYQSRACLLITTTTYGGTEQNVLPWPPLDSQGAAELFIHQTGKKRFTTTERETIRELCESVGHLPLAILLLARQTRITTLAELKKELHAIGPHLAADDKMLVPRHRSLAGCFQISFQRLSREDQDTLFRIGVAPAGLGKALAKDYLEKSEWMSSLTNCVNSALLKVEGERFNLHPLIRSFLHTEMGARKTEWDGHFIDFFCERLDKAADAGKSAELHKEEEVNCLMALKGAVQRGRLEHYLVVTEMLPAEQLSEEEFAQLTQEQVFGGKVCHRNKSWREAGEKLLKAKLVKAQRDGDGVKIKRLVQVLLVEQLPRPGWGSFKISEDNRKVLKAIARINHSQARALEFDLLAWNYFSEQSWNDAEEALRKSLAAWRSAGEEHCGSRDAAMMNLFYALSRQQNGLEAATVAAELWKVCCEEIRFTSVGHPRGEGADWVEWAMALTDTPTFSEAESEAERRRNEFVYGKPEWVGDVWSDVGSHLLHLQQWLEAVRWLENIFPPNEKILFGRKGSGKLQAVALNLARAYMHLSAHAQAEGIHREVSKNPGSMAIFADENKMNAFRGRAKIAAMRGKFDIAAKFAQAAMEAYPEVVINEEMEEERWDQWEREGQSRVSYQNDPRFHELRDLLAQSVDALVSQAQIAAKRGKLGPAVKLVEKAWHAHRRVIFTEVYAATCKQPLEIFKRDFTRKCESDSRLRELGTLIAKWQRKVQASRRRKPKSSRGA